MSPRPLPVPEKRLLTRAEAAVYCGLGPTARPPVAPKRIRPGKQGLRYDRLDLDRWIESLDTDASAEPTAQDYLDRLDDAERQGAGR